jgi:hypothetical protein
MPRGWGTYPFVGSTSCLRAGILLSASLGHKDGRKGLKPLVSRRLVDDADLLCQ